MQQKNTKKNKQKTKIHMCLNTKEKNKKNKNAKLYKSNNKK